MPRKFRGFLSPLEKRYLDFLEYEERCGQEFSNRADWDVKEPMPHRSLDYQIRRKTKQALQDLRLVCERFGFIELLQLFSDSEAINIIKFLSEKVESVESYREARRRERETG
jgi:hypothetical protein